MYILCKRFLLHYTSFSEVCTEHKDNIYSIVDPPSGG